MQNTPGQDQVLTTKKLEIPDSFLCLALESSCDETAASVVQGGRKVLSNIIFSQIAIHKEYGGVVPEIASRNHVESILPVIDRALKEAGVSAQELDIIAVTKGPGLIGALLVGVGAAKGLASVWEKPLVGVNHLEGHICANLLDNKELEPPFISLIASGGHSNIVLVREDFSYQTLARTRDDAPGEAFDKIAREIGLGYPGGPLIDKFSQGGDPSRFSFPQTRFPDGSLDFSFSGLKTASLNYHQKLKHQARKQGQEKIDESILKDFAAGFQEAIVKVLVEHTLEAAEVYGVDTICISGGVAANSLLRTRIFDLETTHGKRVFIPEKIYCTDNAAMIASAGSYSYFRGNLDGLDLNPQASLPL